MGKLWRMVLLTYACIAVQLLVLWSCGSAQVPEGFLSIDCGLPSTTSYTDTYGIPWTSDADLMSEGEALTDVGSNSLPSFANTMRLFRGNQSKYCYRLKNSAVKPGAFLLVRASFWRGTPPPYIPRSNGHFLFKLLIDADEWLDVNLANDSTNWYFKEIYMRALRDSIDICLARSDPNGDDPFISALELRPLPSSLSATRLMNATNRNFISIYREDSGNATSFTRYPSDSLDRFWQGDVFTPFLATKAAIDTSKDQDMPPVNVLQTAYGGTPDTQANISWTYRNTDVNAMNYYVMYFAEIDPRVNASGQRVFNIQLNGETTVNLDQIDVFAEVGAKTSYEIVAGPIAGDEQGIVSFSFSATSTSLFSPFVAAVERFYSKAFSSGSSSNDVIMKPLPMFSIQEFTFQEIQFATNNFNTQIGQGGFGPVYKGRLRNSSIVAIKVSSKSSHQGSKEFLNEVNLLSRIHHKNLVGLLGFCTERKLILVYEFMSKGSLFDCLHGEIARESILSWNTRLRILVDAAQGFDYLHHGCNPRIIHRDIKSSNILLDDKLEAKISDFGISRTSYISESGAPTTALMGSMGYIDPEYLSTMRLTKKIDVYSFGVVIFEVLCGRKALFMDTSQTQTQLVQWIRPYIEHGAIDDIIDVALHGNYNLSSIWKVVDVALACVQFSSDERPDMCVVYSELKEALAMDLKRYQSDMLNIPSPTTTFNEKDYDSMS